jgi:predicted alternative tryptophan synthase beta-subunit
MSDTVKYVLAEERIPKAWYNIAADLPQPPPPVLHPGTKQPVGLDDLAPLFPMALIGQEVSTEREIEIPAPEPTHAIKAVIDEALVCKEEGVARTILFNLCGQGHFDMQAYTDYLAGTLVDEELAEGALAEGFAGLPPIAAQ